MTGKMHQLRIVSKYINCPIVGDLKYNSDIKYRKEELKLNAFSLEFEYQKLIYEFKSVLPDHFRFFLKQNKIFFK